MTAPTSTHDQLWPFRFHGAEIGERDFITYIVPVGVALAPEKFGLEPPPYVYLSPHWRAPERRTMNHVPQLSMGPDDRLRLAWTDDPIDTVTVTGVLRLDALDMVILHTDDEEICVLHVDEYASQV